MHDLTVLTLVHNVRDRIRRGLESVSWADEIYCVVDPNTTDGSDEIARELASRVDVHEYVNAANQRNWALPSISTEWTLVLDADEWVSAALAEKINALIRDDNSSNGYDIRRRSYFFGKLINHCGWHHDYNLRLFRTAQGRYLEKRVHSKVVVEGPVGTIREPMYHDTFRTFDEYFATAQRFSTWGAEDLFESGKRARVTDLTLRPLVRWFHMYFIRHGFLDGYHGAVLCGLTSCQVFLKYAKLWNLQRKAKLDSEEIRLSAK